MKDWALLTDEELVLEGQQGNHQAMDEVISRYKSFVRKKANTLFLAGADYDDLVQEGMIGLFQAFRDYVPERQASFRTFAGICISGQMNKAIEAAGRNKHIPKNKYVSLFTETGEGDTLESQLEMMEETDPANLYIDKENVQRLMKRIEGILSPLEWEVFIRYIDGESCRQIATVLEKDEKAVTNARDRIRSKITKEIAR